MTVTNDSIHPINIDVKPLQISQAKSVKAEPTQVKAEQKVQENIVAEKSVAEEPKVSSQPALSADTQAVVLETPHEVAPKVKVETAQQAYSKVENKSQTEVEQSRIDLSA